MAEGTGPFTCPPTKISTKGEDELYPRNAFAPLTVKGSQCALSVVCRVQQEAEKMIMKIMKDLGKD